MQIKIIRFHMI